MNALSNTAIPHLETVEFETELERILGYWSDKVFDHANARFYPRVDHAGNPDCTAVTGAVMYARILWAFSSGYHHTGTLRYLELADIAFRYIRQNLIDAKYGGVYWSLRPDGRPADSRKQIYAMAFTIYGLAAYYKVNNDDAVLALAKAQYRAIEKYSWDTCYGGYIEALARDWSPTAHLSLSEKDNNEKKTLNTHLHVLEAYTSLYGIWPNDSLKQRINDIIGLFEAYFITPEGHLSLFFDERWQSKSALRSFGHEIETSWLLCEASYAVNGGQLTETVRTSSLRLADASLQAIDATGALPYEFDPRTGTLIAEKHWWVQAEALVGFYHAGVLASNSKYLTTASRIWQYIKDQLIDHQQGEWYWGRDENGHIMTNEDKAGFWKCPYHNSRCCIELIRRLGRDRT